MKPDPADVVEQYLTHVSAHQIDLAMACLSDAFHLEFAGSDFKMSKDGARQALEWDVGTNGQLSWTTTEAAADHVQVVGYESNDFLQLLGIGNLNFRARFDVDDDVIVRQVHEVDWGGKSVEEALKPVVSWAAANEPDELAAIYPEGRLAYTRESGQRWVAMLRRWRAATD